MKRFLIQIVSFVLVVLGIVSIINVLYMRNHVFEIIKDVPEGIEICNFGNSQPYNGLDYSIIDQYTCYNFALPAQSFSYDLRILKNYKDKIKPGAKVLICCSYHALFGLPEIENADFASKNRRYYCFLPKELIKEYDPTTNIMTRYLPALTAGETLIPTVLGVYKSDVCASGTVTTASEETALSSSQARFDNLFGGARDTEGNINYDLDDIKCLEEMIDIVKELGCTPILFTTPYLKEFVDTIQANDPELLEVFYKIINGIAKEKQIKYYDWSQDARFNSSYELFTNLDHLNKNGAKAFTQIVVKELNRDS